TISSKKCTRGSLRVKQSCKADWNSHNSSMKPSTSLGTRSKVGMVKPSPLVRQAGNIRGLLRIHEICRRNIRSSCSHVKDRCRCRGKPLQRFEVAIAILEGNNAVFIPWVLQCKRNLSFHPHGVDSIGREKYDKPVATLQGTEDLILPLLGANDI